MSWGCTTNTKACNSIAEKIKETKCVIYVNIRAEDSNVAVLLAILAIPFGEVLV